MDTKQPPRRRVLVYVSSQDPEVIEFIALSPTERTDDEWTALLDAAHRLWDALFDDGDPAAIPAGLATEDIPPVVAACLAALAPDLLIWTDFTVVDDMLINLSSR